MGSKSRKHAIVYNIRQNVYYLCKVTSVNSLYNWDYLLSFHCFVLCLDPRFIPDILLRRLGCHGCIHRAMQGGQDADCGVGHSGVGEYCPYLCSLSSLAHLFFPVQPQVWIYYCLNLREGTEGALILLPSATCNSSGRNCKVGCHP